MRQMKKNISPQDPNEDEKSVLNTVRTATSKWYYVPALVVWFIVGVMPTLYAYRAEVPPLDELKLASGELFSERIRYEGSWTYGAVLKSEGTSMHFVCPGFGNDCWEIKKRKDIHGKQAIISWFEQSKWPWGSRNLLVELQIAQEKVITSEMTKRELQKYATDWSYISLVAFFVGIVIFWMIDKTIRDHGSEKIRKIREAKNNNGGEA